VEDTPLRLLLLIDSLEIGGAERHVVDLALALRARGHWVTVGSSSDGPLQSELLDASIEVRRTLCGRVKRRISQSYAAAVRRLIQAEQFHAVHAHLYASAWAASMAVAGSNVPLLVTEHTEGRWQGVDARRAAMQYMHRAWGVIAVSEGIRDRLVRELAVPVHRVSVAPNAIPPGSVAGQRMWRSFGVTVGVVARLCPEKGVDLFLEAIACIGARHPEVSFVVIGDGPLREQLQLMAARLGVLERVCFTGALVDARAVMAQFGLLVVPSRTEGTPLVVLEALAAGVPIIAARVGGIPSQMRDGVDGVLIPPDDSKRLSEAMDRLLCHPELLQGGVPSERIDGGAYAQMVNRVEALYRVAARGALRQRV
jgi:glycosyltransferase involved in cell wall biosynthesis